MARKLVDCFIFYNEIKMLKFRLKELEEVVDSFVLVESTKTHSGKSKKLFFDEIKHEFDTSKIIHVVVDDFPDSTDSWALENHQRRCIMRGLEQLSLQDRDLVLISDVDEIPDFSLLKKVKNNFGAGIRSLRQKFYYYNLKTKVVSHDEWTKSKLVDFGTLKMIGDCQKTRFIEAPILENAGWHFSYFGDAEFISNKIKNFAHQEFNLQHFTDTESINKHVSNSTDIFGRSEKYVTIEIENNDYLPNNYKMLL